MVAEKTVLRFAFLGLFNLVAIIIVAFFLGSIGKPSSTKQQDQGSTLARTTPTMPKISTIPTTPNMTTTAPPPTKTSTPTPTPKMPTMLASSTKETSSGPSI